MNAVSSLFPPFSLGYTDNMLQRVRVKICGLRDPAQARKIVQMGADAVGLMFASSPRWVSPEQARAVTDALPPYTTAVGVFVNSDAEDINRVAQRVGLSLVQLHGDEGPAIVAQLALPCVKAFAVRDAGWIDQVRAWMDGVTDRRKLAGILLDAHNPQMRGGTGQRFNWDLVADARAAGKLQGMPPLILSGGLSPEVVSDAIEIVQPWAVDVSTGVEESPGIKDVRKVEAFIRKTREGDVLRSEFWLP
jgi:phosphoribosylanthranilate isomerase